MDSMYQTVSTMYVKKDANAMDKPLVLYIAFLLTLFNASLAVRRVDVFERASEVKRRNILFHDKIGLVDDRNTPVKSLLDLSDDESLSVTYEMESAQGIKLQKLKESYKGIPLFDTAITVGRGKDGKLTENFSGHLWDQIKEDLPNPKPTFGKKKALRKAMLSQRDIRHRRKITRFTVDNFIYITSKSKSKQKARSVYLVSYFLIKGKAIKQPSVLLDAISGKILRKWNNFQTCKNKAAKAFGGNKKMGKKEFGHEPYCLEPTVRGDMCLLENEHVQVIDMQSKLDNLFNTTVTFKCSQGYNDAKNGGYSPAVDAFFYGTMFGRMFKEWFHSSPLGGQKMTMKVHVGPNLANAFWDGKSCSFGDGGSQLYPLTTADIVGHEMAHAVTQFSSGLVYEGESGGLNEAFSDIMGESTEYFYQKSFDSKIGEEVSKVSDALREFKYPDTDGASISHVDDFETGMDPHYSSGVYRKVFSVLTEKKRWAIDEIAHAFLHANRMYWTEQTSFYDAGCGLLKAAYDLGQEISIYEYALDYVGIQACDLSRHIRMLDDGVPVENLRLNRTTKPMFGFAAPMISLQERVIVEAFHKQEDVLISVRVGMWGAVNEAEFLIDGDNSLVVEGVNDNFNMLYIEFSSFDEDLEDVIVKAQLKQSF